MFSTNPHTYSSLAYYEYEAKEAKTNLDLVAQAAAVKISNAVKDYGTDDERVRDLVIEVSYAVGAAHHAAISAEKALKKAQDAQPNDGAETNKTE